MPDHYSCCHHMYNSSLNEPAVILACRDQARGEKLKHTLLNDAKADGNSSPTAEVMLLDVSSLQSVRSFAEQWIQQKRPLHGLINNAGIFDIGSSNVSHSFTQRPCSALIRIVMKLLLVLVNDCAVKVGPTLR